MIRRRRLLHPRSPVPHDSPPGRQGGALLASQALLPDHPAITNGRPAVVARYYDAAAAAAALSALVCANSCVVTSQMAQGLAHFWNEWGIQVLVLFSFTLQVMLLTLAGTRRHKSSAPLRLLLWLMYQLADSTAIYTLGHLSVASSKAQDQHLVAFWAPFLLVHLGGPGTITAYALEDNRLWLRHLLTLSVQVLGAAFVIYKQDQDKSFGDEELLLGAHSLFHVCKIRFVDATERVSEFEQTCTRWYGGKDLSGLLETELSLMYDILYTKAAVVHTWYGYTILVISPVATAAALLLFHYSSHKQGDSKVNVGITYALLSGTLALDLISGQGHRVDLGMHPDVLFRVGAASGCRHLPPLAHRGSKQEKMVRFHGAVQLAPPLHPRQDRAGRQGGCQAGASKYSGTTSISTTDLKDRMLPLFSYIRPNLQGVGALESMMLFENSAEYAYSTLSDFAFDDSILYWHIATDVYLSESKVEHEEKLVVAVQVLSNYMMFLMIAQPEMLTGPIQQGQYVDTFNDLDRLWDHHCLSNQHQGHPQKWWTMVKKLFQRDQPNASRMRQRKELATKFITVSADIIHEEVWVQSES
ncbi:hypothetical protein HU200_051265 [Digitaria exilis]|uniref:DUF4220 domain-containing protein n=1 Tax=Digitaria exilis TaxID=1010633 RepID=A0A835E5I7_9POAL|nr:hypothetical protein HU200_051265 [Digitaria exilis]